MNLHLFLAYTFAVAILILMPGPIVTLVVANSLSHGSRSGLATVAGASLGNAILLGATAVGLVLQGFLVAITNPKAMVFYIAFLPQFIDTHAPAGPQLLVMTGTMIIMALLSDSAYALLAGRARRWFVAPARRRLQARISGTLLIGVGCGLLLARQGN